MRERMSGARGRGAGWLGGMATGLWAAQAWAQEGEGLREHAMGNAYLSYGLFGILGLVVLFVVFKGTRTR